MRVEKQPVNLHHRLPKSTGGSEEPINLAVVTIAKHRSYHHLFDTLPPEDVCIILNQTWIDPSKKLICVPDNVYFELRSYLACRGMIHFETLHRA